MSGAVTTNTEFTAPSEHEHKDVEREDEALEVDEDAHGDDEGGGGTTRGDCPLAGPNPGTLGVAKCPRQRVPDGYGVSTARSPPSVVCRRSPRSSGLHLRGLAYRPFRELHSVVMCVTFVVEHHIPRTTIM